MAENSPEITVNAQTARQVAETFYSRPGTKIQRAAFAVGELRPDATPAEKMQEEDLLNWRKGHFEEHFISHQIPKDNKEPYQILPIECLITENDKRISEKLEPEGLVLMRLLVTGDWKKKFDKPTAGTLILSRWTKGIFPDDQKGRPDLNYRGYGKYEFPAELISEVCSMESTLQGRRRAFKIAIASGPKYADVRNKQLWGVEFKHLPVDEYSQVAAAALIKEVNGIMDKDRTNGVGLATITCGLELEMESRTKDIGRKDIDSLRRLGIPVTYETVAFGREIPLPYSSSLGQVRAIFELFKMGIIGGETNVNLHINLGQLGKVIDEDIFVLNGLIMSGDLVKSSSKWVNNPKDKPLIYNEYSRKPLLSGDLNGPRGLPFLQRLDKSTLEFRGGYILTGESFIKFARDLTAISAMGEALAAFRRLKWGESGDNLEQDTQLAKVWVELKENFRQEAENNIEGYKDFEVEYAKDGNSMVDLEKKYALVQSKILNSVKNADFRDRNLALAYKAKSEVRKILSGRIR